MPEGSEKEIMRWKYLTPGDEKRRIFEGLRDLILAEWIRQRPGRRPNFWWRSEAPEKCRQRLGGIGDAAHDFLAYVEDYDHGIPSIFIDPWLVDYYNGRAVDVNGELIDPGDDEEGGFAGRAIDPNDPPRYESQAAFLKRHGLLMSSEERRLKPKDFAPEVVRGEKKRK